MHLAGWAIQACLVCPSPCLYSLCTLCACPHTPSIWLHVPNYLSTNACLHSASANRTRLILHSALMLTPTPNPKNTCTLQQHTHTHVLRTHPPTHTQARTVWLQLPHRLVLDDGALSLGKRHLHFLVLLQRRQEGVRGQPLHLGFEGMGGDIRCSPMEWGGV